MISLSKLDVSETDQIAKIHQNAFQNFFLTSLGSNFLSVFYSSIIKSDKAIAIGAYYDNRLIGFAVGTKSKRGFYVDILKSNFGTLFYSAIKHLVFNPNKILRLAKSFLTKETTSKEYLNCASLLSICVEPNKSGGNIGKKLLEAFELETKKYNNEITLTTDKDENEYVNAFYKKNGYVLCNTFNQGNRQMNLYYKKLKL